MICSSAAIVASSSSANWPCLRADSLPRLARQGPDVMDLLAKDAGLADVDLPRTGAAKAVLGVAGIDEGAL